MLFSRLLYCLLGILVQKQICGDPSAAPLRITKTVKGKMCSNNIWWERESKQQSLGEVVVIQSVSSLTLTRFYQTAWLIPASYRRKPGFLAPYSPIISAAVLCGRCDIVCARGAQHPTRASSAATLGGVTLRCSSAEPFTIKIPSLLPNPHSAGDWLLHFFFLAGGGGKWSRLQPSLLPPTTPPHYKGLTDGGWREQMQRRKNWEKHATIKVWLFKISFFEEMMLVFAATSTQAWKPHVQRRSYRTAALFRCPQIRIALQILAFIVLLEALSSSLIFSSSFFSISTDSFTFFSFSDCLLASAVPPLLASSCPLQLYF